MNYLQVIASKRKINSTEENSEIKLERGEKKLDEFIKL